MSEIVAARDVMLERGWLSRMPPAFRRRVLAQCQHRKVKGGTQVFQLGDSAGGLFGVVRGGVAIEIVPAGRGPNLVSLMRPGGWFGSAAALTGQERRIGARTTRDSELLYLPVQAMDAIVADDLEAWRYFVLLPISEFEAAIALCDDLMRREHVQRFVGVLLHLCGCRRETPPHFEPIELDVGQEDVANMANVARTTAGSILRKLESAGQLELSYRRIRILSPTSLRQMLRR